MDARVARRFLEAQKAPKPAAPSAEKQFFDNIDFIPELHKAKARLQDANIGFTASNDALPFLQAGEMIFDLCLATEVKSILFKRRRKIAKVFSDISGQRAFAIDRPLQGYHHRYPEIIEEANKVRRIFLDPGSRTPFELRQEKFLDVHDDATTPFRVDALHHIQSPCSRGMLGSDVSETTDRRQRPDTRSAAADS